MTKIKWGILGNASIARGQMIPGLKKAEYSELYAIASRGGVPEEIAPDVRHYDSYEALLDDEQVQAVYVPLPNALHCEWAIRAMKKGKHVLSEKPIAMNEQQAREMFETAKQQNVYLMEAFMYRFTNKTKKVLELVKNGAIGQIKDIHVHHGYTLNWDSPARQVSELGGGSVYDVGCYGVSFIQAVLGMEPEELNAGFVMTEAGYDQRAAVWMRFSGGAMATMESWFDAAADQRALIVGTEGTIEVMRFPTGGRDVLLLNNKEGRQEIEVEECVPFALEADALSRAILGLPTWLLPEEETLACMRTMDRILQLRK